jgi:hypothetical protein
MATWHDTLQIAHCTVASGALRITQMEGVGYGVKVRRELLFSVRIKVSSE